MRSFAPVKRLVSKRSAHRGANRIQIDVGGTREHGRLIEKKLRHETETPKSGRLHCLLDYIGVRCSQPDNASTN